MKWDGEPGAKREGTGRAGGEEAFFLLEVRKLWTYMGRKGGMGQERI